MRGGSKPGERRGGRQVGTPNRTSLLARLRIEQEADPIGRLIEASKTGVLKLGEKELRLDVDQGLSVIRELRRIAVPDAKGVSFTLALPAINTAADIDAALGIVIAEVAAARSRPMKLMRSGGYWRRSARRWKRSIWTPRGAMEAQGHDLAGAPSHRVGAGTGRNRPHKSCISTHLTAPRPRSRKPSCTKPSLRLGARAAVSPHIHRVGRNRNRSGPRRPSSSPGRRAKRRCGVGARRAEPPRLPDEARRSRGRTSPQTSEARRPRNRHGGVAKQFRN